MTPTRTAKTAAGKPVTLALLEDLFGPSSERPFALRLWDGTVDGPGVGHEPSFTLVLNRPGALRRMLLPPTDLTLGEAYLRDDFDVEGDLEKATELADVLAARLRSPAMLARLARRLRRYHAEQPLRRALLVGVDRRAGDVADGAFVLHPTCSATNFANRPPQRLRR